MNLLASEELTDDEDLVFNSPDLHGIECAGCRRPLAFKYFNKNAAYRTGYEPLCVSCQSVPRLSIEEHHSRLRENNLNSESVKKQRHEDQEEFKKHDARLGRPMHTSEFLFRVQKLVPALFVKEGGIAGHLALYLTAPQPRGDWQGNSFNYLGYLEFDTLPEFSQYEFDTERDIMIRESVRGWRTPLLRLLKAGVVTEDQINKEFGYASGEGSEVWYHELKKERTKRLIGDKVNG